MNRVIFCIEDDNMCQVIFVLIIRSFQISMVKYVILISLKKNNNMIP